MRAVLLSLICCGCAGAVIRPRPQAILFEDSSAALEWRAPAGPGSREVHGESCRSAIGFPLFFYGGQDLVGWGDAGYRGAVAAAQAQAPGSTLSDVRVDARFVNILIWRKDCLEVTAAAR